MKRPGRTFPGQLKTSRDSYLASRRCHISWEHYDSALEVLLFKDTQQSVCTNDQTISSPTIIGINALSHCLDTNALLIREKHEYLFHWVVLVIREEVQLASTASAFSLVPSTGQVIRTLLSQSYWHNET